MGLTLRGYGTYSRRQTVTAAAKRIRQVLNEAKANANAYKIDCSVCGGLNGLCDGTNDDLPLAGWEAGRESADTFRIRGQCGNDLDSNPTCPNNTCFMLKSDTFTGVSIASAAQRVVFRPGGAGVSNAVTFTVSGWGYSETVTVSSGGLVQ
jgi:hypothetical protein